MTYEISMAVRVEGPLRPLIEATLGTEGPRIHAILDEYAFSRLPL
jgi:hypothetical protein